MTCDVMDLRSCSSVASLSMQPGAGDLLRGWRQRRHLSQLELSVRTGVSSRHLSCIETGRSQPSRQMVLYLAEHLSVPLRERNALLLASGYAPSYSSRALGDDSSDMRYVRDAVERLLASHDPYPAFVIDRRWNVVARNESTGVLLKDVARELLTPPVNALRVALHPSGLAPRIANLTEWSAYLLGASITRYSPPPTPDWRNLPVKSAATPGSPNPISMRPIQLTGYSCPCR